MFQDTSKVANLQINISPFRLWIDNPAVSNSIEFITISNFGSSSDFGDLTLALWCQSPHGAAATLVYLVWSEWQQTMP